MLIPQTFVKSATNVGPCLNSKTVLDSIEAQVSGSELEEKKRLFSNSDNRLNKLRQLYFCAVEPSPEGLLKTLFSAA